jgi:hypothetical protein
LDKTDIGLKSEAFRNNQHEALVSVSLDWGIGHSGSVAVGADAPDTVRPGIFFGKGFGDLPAQLSWLRPFAITGAIIDKVPLGSVGRALAPNLATGGFDRVISSNGFLRPSRPAPARLPVPACSSTAHPARDAVGGNAVEILLRLWASYDRRIAIGMYFHP